MSRATKRKHVMKEVLDDFSLPDDNQQIVRVLCSKGNNLHEVESSTGDKFLISMPTKFRKNIWVKRGDFILIDPIEEGDKVKGEMCRALTNEHIKYFKTNQVWPDYFNSNTSLNKTPSNDSLESPSLYGSCNSEESLFDSDSYASQSGCEGDSELEDDDDEKSTNDDEILKAVKKNNLVKRDIKFLTSSSSSINEFTSDDDDADDDEEELSAESNYSDDSLSSVE